MKLTPFLCAVLFASCGLASAQHAATVPTSLATLLVEAEASNSQVQAADDTWKALAHVSQQVSAFPAPEFAIQSSSAGSPRPFAGFSNSEFAYLGLSASQDIPYPGKLKLRSEVADREMEAQKADADAVRASVAEQVKLLYLQISYSNAQTAYLDREDSLLQSLIKDALARYSLGKGSQSAILRAQMERTRLLREDTMHKLDLGQAQARLKQLVHRRQDSPDILPDPLAATPFTADPDELESQLRTRNATLESDAGVVEKQKAQLASAKREGKPDFNVTYGVELTGEGYRNRYLLSANVRLPNRGRVAGEIAQAAEQANRAMHVMDSDVQQKLAELQEQLVAVKGTDESLRELKDGLIPQAEALFHSEESAYQSNNQELAPVLSALLDILTLESEYQQTLLDHESALARIETLTGGTLR